MSNIYIPNHYNSRSYGFQLVILILYKKKLTEILKRILSTQHFNFKSFSFVCNFVAADLTSASSTRLFLFTFEFCRQAGNSGCSSRSIGNFESMRFLYQLFGNHNIFQNIPRISNDLHAGERDLVEILKIGGLSAKIFWGY